MLRHLILVAALSVGPLLPLSVMAQPLVQDVPQSAQNVSNPTLRGISGITPLGGNLYMVVDDIDGGVGTPQFHVMTLNVNLTSGFLISSLLTSSTGFASGSQYESIEFNSNTGYLYVCSEFDHTIRKVDGDGLQLGFVPTPSIYGSAQGNRSLESLAYQDEIDVLWTANEEELTVDSGTNHVRLQRFVGEVATEQYAYPVELPRNPAGGGFNGLVDLMGLPDGRLLAVERDFNSAALNIGIHLYVINVGGATDISGLLSLTGQSYTPVTKTPVLSASDFPTGYLSSLSNYEGIALGPTLNDGSMALILGPADDADNGFLVPETIKMLKLDGVVVGLPDSGDMGNLVSPAYPNPFSARTQVQFQLGETKHVTANVYGVRGNLVRSLINQTLPAGQHSLLWDGQNELGNHVGGGVYYLNLQWPGQTQTRSLVVTR